MRTIALTLVLLGVVCVSNSQAGEFVRSTCSGGSCVKQVIAAPVKALHAVVPNCQQPFVSATHACKSCKKTKRFRLFK